MHTKRTIQELLRTPADGKADNSRTWSAFIACTRHTGTGMSPFIVAALVLSGTILSGTGFCRAASADINLSGNITFGDYQSSIERDSILTERLNLSFIPDSTSGVTVHFENVSLEKNAGFADIDQNQYGISGYKALLVDAVNGYIGGRLDLQYLDSDDALTDNTLIPYGAVTYMSRDLGLYLDLGYSHSNYDLPDLDQYTATVGLSLFGGKSWSQTRLYFIDPDEQVQKQDETFAVEERLSYYAVPDTLTMTLYGMLGERIFAYDPEIYAVYNLADVQKGSLGGSISYQLTPSLNILGDITWEAYTNYELDDDYAVVYGTAMLTMTF